MQIKGTEIMVSSLLAAEQLATEKIKSKDKISIDDIKIMRHSPLTSEYGLSIVNQMIIFAIQSYHDQLREKLLESGIDIGEMDMQNHERLDRILESRSDTDG